MAAAPRRPRLSGRRCVRFRSALLLLLTLLPGLAGAAEPAGLAGPWPAPDAGIAGRPVRFASSSPFTPADIGRGPEAAPPAQAEGTLFLPEGASAAAPVPAVVLLHGAGGVLASRETVYARQFAAAGVAALVIDLFGPRRDRATGFIERLLAITETMAVADAYAALRHLAAMPEIDARRVALIGFSYGGMAATYAAFAQMAERLAPGGPRFAAHVAFYAPCIARFADKRATGAPVLMLMGGRDAIVDRDRCAEIADDLREGGAAVETIVYEDAYHQWDGGSATPWRARTGLARCRFTVEKSGVVRDDFTMLPMTGPLTRKAILALCADREGYLLGRDDAIRERSNRALGAFLARAFR